jgi:hypothetical protein
MAGYKNQIAQMELSLSKMGIEAPMGIGAPSFRYLRPSVVAFPPNARSIIEDFYKSRDGTLKSSSLAGIELEGRLPNGEVTYYVLEGTTPKDIPEAVKIAGARDIARQVAASDPLAAEGLSRLEDPKEINLGSRKVNEVLAQVRSVDMLAFLRALADPAFTKHLGYTFYLGFAEQPDAMAFARTYGGDILKNFYYRYGR